MKQRIKWVTTPIFGIILVAIAVTSTLVTLVESSGGPK